MTSPAQQLGAELRRIRRQQGLSLAQVEQRSEGRWKAVVVGAYERGDRAITIGRLAELAAFYDVPVTHLLPERAAPRGTAGGDATIDGPEAPEEAGSPQLVADGVLLDLTGLATHVQRDDPVGAVARFARRVQLQRGDHAGRVLTLREADVRTIALAAGLEPDGLRAELRESGFSRSG